MEKKERRQNYENQASCARRYNNKQCMDEWKPNTVSHRVILKEIKSEPKL